MSSFSHVYGGLALIHNTSTTLVVTHKEYYIAFLVGNHKSGTSIVVTHKEYYIAFSSIWSG